MVDNQKDYVTGSGAINYTFAPNKEFVFEELRLHLNVKSETEENFVIQLQSNKGSLYNVKLYSKDMNNLQDLVYQPTKPHDFSSGDSLKITWTNTNLKIWGMEIVYKGSL